MALPYPQLHLNPNILFDIDDDHTSSLFIRWNIRVPHLISNNLTVVIYTTYSICRRSQEATPLLTMFVNQSLMKTDERCLVCWSPLFLSCCIMQQHALTGHCGIMNHIYFIKLGQYFSWIRASQQRCPTVFLCIRKWSVVNCINEISGQLVYS